MIKKEISIKNIQKEKRHFTLAEKKKLYEQWRQSELNRSQFAKKHNLVQSVFCRWCRQFGSASHGTESKWVPVIAKNEKPESSPLLLQILLPNEIKLHISLSLSGLVPLLKELGDASSIIR